MAIGTELCEIQEWRFIRWYAFRKRLESLLSVSLYISYSANCELIRFLMLYTLDRIAFIPSPIMRVPFGF